MSSDGQKRRIFVVDDDATIARTLALILNSHGYDAVGYTDPLAALEAAESFAPELLLTDLAMPRLDGLELAMRMQAMCAGCRVLILSGHIDNRKTRDNALADGLEFEIMVKPVLPRELLAKIETMFG